MYGMAESRLAARRSAVRDAAASDPSVIPDHRTIAIEDDRQTGTIGATRTGSSKKFRLAAWGGLGAVAFLLTQQSQPHWLTASLSIAVAMTALLSAVLISRVKASPVHPPRLGPLVVGWWAVSFGLASLGWRTTQEGIRTQIQIESVHKALVLMLLATALFALSYAVAGRRAGHHVMGPFRRLSHYRQARTRASFTPWIIYALALGGRALAFASTGALGYVGSTGTPTVGAASQLSSVLSALGPLAVIVAGWQTWAERRRGARGTLIVLTLAELGYALVTGVKQDLVVLFISLVVTWVATHGKVPMSLLIAAGAVFVLVVIPFNQIYRGEVRQGANVLSPADSIGQVQSSLTQAIQGTTRGETRLQAFTDSFARVREIDNVALIVQKTPSTIPHRSLIEYAQAPLLGVVPRAVWPSKPVLDTGLQFSYQYYNQPSAVKTSGAVTIPGDLYRHGGLLVLFLGMGVFGWVVRSMDNFLDAISPLSGLLFFSTWFAVLAKAETDVTGLIASVPSFMLAWFLAAVLALPSSRRRSLR